MTAVAIASRAIHRVRIPSRTRPATAYLVTVVDFAPVACTCPDFDRHGGRRDYACKHMRHVRDRVAEALAAT